MDQNQNSQFENDNHGRRVSENSYSYIFSEGMGAVTAMPRPVKRSGRGKRVAVAILGILLCVTLSFGAGFLGSYLSERVAESTGTDPNALFHSDPDSILKKTDSQPSSYGSAGEEAFAVSGVVHMVEDAVVVIDVAYSSSMGYSASGSTGSGVIISENGYILTCNHVVENGRAIQVTLHSGSVYSAVLVGADAESDLAVIKITPNEEEPLTYVEQGCSSDLVVGENVVAIGNPLGMGLTATTGIVSATEQSISMSDGSEMTLIQTDAAINSGNSGGGLFNLDGQLIGIVNAKYSGSGVEGIAFAIPVDSAYEVETQLIQYGYVRGVIDHGLELLEITDQNLYKAYYLYGINTPGVYICSSEYTDDFKELDRIVSVDGISVSTMEELTRVLKGYEVGDTVAVKVSRIGRDKNGSAEEISVSLTLREYVPDRLKQTN